MSHKEIKELDILALATAGTSNADLLAALTKEARDKSIRQRQKPTIINKITDFNDSKVSLISEHCIFSVYSKNSGSEALYKGNNLQKFLNRDKNLMKKFVDKQVESRFEAGDYTITFQYFNEFTK